MRRIPRLYWRVKINGRWTFRPAKITFFNDEMIELEIREFLQMEEEEWSVGFVDHKTHSWNSAMSVCIVILNLKMRNCSNFNGSVKKNDWLLENTRLDSWKRTRACHMSALLASIMKRLAVCSCRICRSQYSSLLVSTACCKEAKALDRRKTTDSILKTGVKSISQQTNLDRSTEKSWEWVNLLLELEKFKKSR
jgi:hypothetical protein